MAAKQRIGLRPEFSAQRMSHPPNPAVATAIEALRRRWLALQRAKVADLGCGKLRHLRLLAPLSSHLFLVDTEYQLTTTHRDGNRLYTIRDLAAKRSDAVPAVAALNDTQFAVTKLSLDVVFCVAVFDVVTLDTRKALTAAAYRNLRRGGLFVLIVPRNDSTILVRCATGNAYADGHAFQHHGAYTFFKNFRDTYALARLCEAGGFTMVEDLSVYRQVCLLFER